MAVRSVIVSQAQGRAPGCGRCGGLVVVESVFANRDGTGTVWLVVGRCVNCGCIDEPVIRANRLQTTAPDRLDRQRHVAVDSDPDGRIGAEKCKKGFGE